MAALIAETVPADGIVAFTFTRRAAEELTNRIARRVEQRCGKVALDRLGGLYVGTIHGYCFQLLQQWIPRYETYDALDDNQLTAFLTREAHHLELRQLDPAGRNRLYASISAFLQAVDVVENEMIDPASLDDPLRTILLAYYDRLESFRLLTYGQQVVRAVRELEQPELGSSVHTTLRHLVVDEYRDINPAQEKLIQTLTGPETHLCVVGDDHQAIYQWRGSDIANIVEFPARYPYVTTFEITTNRRSRPAIIEVANQISATIPGGIDKAMHAARTVTDGAPEVVVWRTETEADEAGWIAGMIDQAAQDGVPYRDIAVLVRTRAAYPRLMEAFATFGIPVQPGGRSGLFAQPEAKVLGKAIAWLTNLEWREGYGHGKKISDYNFFSEFERTFDLTPAHRRRVEHYLREWKQAVPNDERTADLVGELYELLDVLDVRTWDLTDRIQVNRLGTIARFSSLLADYESVRRRARSDPTSPGEQIGGQDRGLWYYQNLGLYIINYAESVYEGFDGEPDYGLDAVDLTTVHRAKGLEWPVVFVPSLTTNRFPSPKSGRKQNWLIPRTEPAWGPRGLLRLEERMEPWTSHRARARRRGATRSS